MRRMNQGFEVTRVPTLGTVRVSTQAEGSLSRSERLLRRASPSSEALRLGFRVDSAADGLADFGEGAVERATARGLPSVHGRPQKGEKSLRRPGGNCFAPRSSSAPPGVRKETWSARAAHGQHVAGGAGRPQRAGEPRRRSEQLRPYPAYTRSSRSLTAAIRRATSPWPNTPSLALTDSSQNMRLAVLRAPSFAPIRSVLLRFLRRNVELGASRELSDIPAEDRRNFPPHIFLQPPFHSSPSIHVLRSLPPLKRSPERQSHPRGTLIALACRRRKGLARE